STQTMIASLPSSLRSSSINYRYQRRIRRYILIRLLLHEAMNCSAVKPVVTTVMQNLFGRSRDGISINPRMFASIASSQTADQTTTTEPHQLERFQPTSKAASITTD